MQWKSFRRAQALITTCKNTILDRLYPLATLTPVVTNFPLRLPLQGFHLPAVP